MPKVEEFYPSRASRREPPVESLWVERLGRTIIFIHIKRQSEAIHYFDIRNSLFDIRYLY